MDTQGLLPAPARPPRRKHSLQFKEQVVAASYAPNTSVASVAQQFKINANLVHKWRRQFDAKAAGRDDFIKVAPRITVKAMDASCPDTTLKVELSSALGPVTIHWPMADLAGLASWLNPQP
ncbi:transposase [Zhongshania sp. BJYM1]|uniref:transposase n=1 Tax=Zhongshania aquatica TaxID=2965069 RepID=UPI0022B38465|nr:transposase [Marortus sp. BJYM1]MBU0801130.1 transposase [Alphaproteobacteria bacterium]|tara:strand:- start:2010 stop:2372 length:363 start_codon:yes stop_codon:yes gene_type:complete